MATVAKSKTNLPSFSTFISTLVIGFLLYAFFSKLTIKFYASALFFFYHYIQHMWLAVVALGAFQTLLMMPFRIVNLSLSANVKEFEAKVEELKSQEEQQFLIKQTVSGGNPTMLWYLINFFIQTVAYLSIGRMFLIDFYNLKLNPNFLFSFVPYPDYPIKDPIFKIPYPAITQTKDFGLAAVFIAWGLILVYKFFHSKFISYYRRLPDTKKFDTSGNALFRYLKRFFRYSGGFLTVFFVLSWLLLRHFPVSWQLRIFTGDVGVPNYRLNFITAVGAFIIVLWLNLPKISNKAQLARAMGIPEDVIFKTQQQLFKDSLRAATLLGLGAYYITRFIPSAFELSIFTLEIISFLSPLTIDRLVFSRFRAPPPASDQKTGEKTDSS
jgi:hypothetical protein